MSDAADGRFLTRRPLPDAFLDRKTLAEAAPLTV